jgi:hypothetical protein
MTCQHCKKESDKVVELHGWKLCENCRGVLKRAKKKQKRSREMSSYLDALTHPELRGLKGVRK